MKILEIVSTLSPGGAERFVVDLSNELSKSNNVTLLTFFDESLDSNRSFYKFDLSNRVEYLNLKLSDHFSIKKAWKIYKEIKRINPDVVHINGFLVPYYTFFALLFLSRKIKFFQTIHNDIKNGYTNTFYTFLFKVFGYSKRMGFIALSQTNYNDMIHYYPKVKGTCIVNGRAPIIPTPEISNVKLEIDKYKKTRSSKVFIHIARFNPQKNQILLIQCFNELINKGYDADLVIIGAGFEKADNLKMIASNRIHFIGTRKNIGDYLLCSDIFCLSSIFEGMPISMLEASLAGVPIVSTPVCGALDLIKNGVNGIRSTDFSEVEYLQALEKSYNNLQKLKEGATTMKDSNQYTISLCSQKYIDFFQLT